MAGFVPKQKKICMKLTGLPSQDKIERLVYVSLRESTLNIPVKAVRRVISAEYETTYASAIIYIYLHRNDNSYVEHVAKAINDREFECENGRRYAVEATKIEEKGLPREYTGLQRDQGVTVKLTMHGGNIIDIHDTILRPTVLRTQRRATTVTVRSTTTTDTNSSNARQFRRTRHNREIRVEARFRE
jgi:hypothetical protein